MIKITNDLLIHHASSFDRAIVKIKHDPSWPDGVRRMYPDGSELKGHFTMSTDGKVLFLPETEDDGLVVFRPSDFTILRIWRYGRSMDERPAPNAWHCPDKDRCVYVTGHGDVSPEEFFEKYEPVIRELHSRCYNFVVGDFKGVDFMAQCLLALIGAHYTVFHMHEKPRNYVSSEYSSAFGGFRSDRERDDAMIDKSSAIVGWVRPGREDSGTARNIALWSEKKT